MSIVINSRNKRVQTCRHLTKNRVNKRRRVKEQVYESRQFKNMKYCNLEKRIGSRYCVSVVPSLLKLLL